MTQSKVTEQFPDGRTSLNEILTCCYGEKIVRAIEQVTLSAREWTRIQKNAPVFSCIVYNGRLHWRVHMSGALGGGKFWAVFIVSLIGGLIALFLRYYPSLRDLVAGW